MIAINEKSLNNKSGGSFTINDLASYTGLSRSTVSRVINQSSRVSPQARETVLSAIEDLGYVPNLIARGLRTTPKIIGVVMQDILNPYYIEALYEIERICKEHGYALLHMNSDSDPAMEGSNLYQLLSMKVQGIILLGNMLDETDKMVQLSMTGTHLITMEGIINGVDSVLSEPTESIRQMVATLLEYGHTNFGLVHHNMRSYPIQQRESIFIDELKKNGILLAEDNKFYGNDYVKQVNNAYENGSLPTALFALNDNTACNLYRWCRQKNIAIPAELSVIGFDDVKTFQMMMPTLTTIHQPIGKLAEIATNLLIEKIESQDNGFKEPKKVLIDTEFIHRESIGSVRKNTK